MAVVDGTVKYMSFSWMRCDKVQPEQSMNKTFKQPPCAAP